MQPPGVVVIGRNEGERLARCLRSLDGAGPVVYVDSGSADGSPERAAALGAEVVRLDPAAPFTAARGRNAGFRRLREVRPGVELVQFVDGDCELDPGWLAAAGAALAAHPGVAVVCGRRRERFPDATRYNRLCDLEWDTPVGEAAACGGDALMRAAAVGQVGGYREGLIAGEEPELCARLRAAGWTVLRIDAEMTRHDAAMTRFGQWWRRAVRAGHAYAEVSALHGRGPDRTWVREVRSNWFWGAGVPAGGLLAAAAAGAAWPPAAVGVVGAGAAGYALLAARVYRHARRRGRSAADARLSAAFTLLAKLPLAVGQGKYWLARRTGRAQPLIEYKSAGAAAC